MTTRPRATSDLQLRALERRALETGDADDQAAWLLQRTRVGALDRLRLELAAQCGHEGARRAVGAAAERSFAALPPGALPALLELLAELASAQPRSVRLAMALKEAALELVRPDATRAERTDVLVSIAAAIARAKRMARRPRTAAEGGAGWIFSAALELAESLLDRGVASPAALQSLDEALRSARFRGAVAAALLA